ncbi:serine/threonine protein kinase [Butyrivibrio sp. CB08]|uniref:serine/threonine protein kinase n=1 Tax=Butyrivibrio sp. CB08 TaxID=2364879 RepID=UPI000EAA99E2|nr:serine/threonine-protein kinase [Butyrivibrio sp. CB08]RKM55403.1 serine/threonine protein kinase [Butyrivibrio sp. CB08]
MDPTYHPNNSNYKTIAILNESHGIYLVQNQSTNRIFVKKILDVYNPDIYKKLYSTPVPGTPKIIEFFEQDNQLTIIEEYISGTPLQEKLQEGVRYNDVMSYITDLCSVLKRLHAFTPPIIHRDIKPSNIIITNFNRAILIDFNAAKNFSSAASEDTRLLGTQGYAAPEQYGFGSSSPQTDVYSLGIVLKEMLTSCQQYPSELDRIVAKCTQMNPKERYLNINELERALQAISSPNNTHVKQDSIKDFIPPGFRTLTPWKMIIAIPVYTLILWLCLTLEVKNVYGLALWVERIFCLAMFLSIIFGFFNYRDIQRFIPLCKHKNPVVRFLGSAILVVAMVFTLLISMILIEIVFFHVT